MRNELLFKKSRLPSINFLDDSFCCVFDATQISTLSCSALADKYLHPNERLVFKQRKKTLAQKEYLASRFIIKHIVTQWQGCAFNSLDVQFNNTANKLQVYMGGECLPYQIALSHAKGQVLLVLAPQAIDMGVDLEYIDTKRNINALAESFFHPAEQAVMALNGPLAFYQLWTLKEAVAKMQGRSVMTLLAEDITLLANTLITTSTRYQDFIISIVSSEPLKDDNIYILTIPQLVKEENE